MQKFTCIHLIDPSPNHGRIFMAAGGETPREFAEKGAKKVADGLKEVDQKKGKDSPPARKIDFPEATIVGGKKAKEGPEVRALKAALSGLDTVQSFKIDASNIRPAAATLEDPMALKPKEIASSAADGKLLDIGTGPLGGAHTEIEGPSLALYRAFDPDAQQPGTTAPERVVKTAGTTAGLPQAAAEAAPRDGYFDKAIAQLKKDAGPAKKLETPDDSQLFKNLIIAAGTEKAWEQFKADYVEAKRDGELKTGTDIERFQKAWAKMRLGRENIYSDMAALKSQLSAKTVVEMTPKKRQEGFSRALDRFGYEIGYALGLDGAKLNGEEIAKLYSLPTDADLLAKASAIEFNHKNKVLEIKGDDGMILAHLTKDASPAGAQYLAQLKTEKGIA